MAAGERIGGELDLGVEGGGERPGSALRVVVERANRTVLIRPQGDLDADTHADLVDVADAALGDSCDDLIISCEDLKFVDSSGLRALLAVRAACAGTETRLHLVKRAALLDELLEVTGLDAAFT